MFNLDVIYNTFFLDKPIFYNLHLIQVFKNYISSLNENNKSKVIF